MVGVPFISDCLFDQLVIGNAKNIMNNKIVNIQINKLNLKIDNTKNIVLNINVII